MIGWAFGKIEQTRQECKILVGKALAKPQLGRLRRWLTLQMLRVETFYLYKYYYTNNMLHLSAILLEDAIKFLEDFFL